MVFIAIEMKDIWLWCMNIWPWCGMHVDGCWNEQNWGGKMKRTVVHLTWVVEFCLNLMNLDILLVKGMLYIYLHHHWPIVPNELLKLLENASTQIFFAIDAWFNHFKKGYIYFDSERKTYNKNYIFTKLLLSTIHRFCLTSKLVKGSQLWFTFFKQLRWGMNYPITDISVDFSTHPKICSLLLIQLHVYHYRNLNF
jgi:hypothetical protein